MPALPPPWQRVSGQSVVRWLVGVLFATACAACDRSAPFERADPNALAALEYARETLAQDGPAPALKVLEGARSQFPDSFEIAHEYARQAASQSDLEGAIDAYVELLDRDPGVVQPARELLQVALFIGRADLSERAAQVVARQAAPLSSDLALLAREACNRGDYAAAMSWAARAVETDPQCAESQWQAASILLDAERCVEAEPYLRRAVALDPGHSGAQFALGTWLMRYGDDPEMGARHLSYSEAIRSLSSQSYGRADVAERLATARAVTRTHPGWANGWIEAAKAQLSLGRPRRAADLLERAADCTPEHPEFTHLRWEVATATGDSRTAARLAAEIEERARAAREEP